MPDSLEALLRQSPLTQTQRADLWDAYQGAGDANALTTALQAFTVPKQVKASLWDLKAASHVEDGNPLSAFTNVTSGKSSTAKPYNPPSGVVWPVGRFQMAEGDPNPRLNLPDSDDLAAAAPIALAPAGGAGVGIAKPIVGRIAGLASNPLVVGGGTAAYKMATGSNPVSAIIDGLQTAGGVASVKGIGAIASKLPGTAGRAARAVETATSAVKAAKAAKAAKATTTLATNLDRGATVAAQHAAKFNFAKEVAARKPKLGEKIWLLLDDAGNPVKWLSPDQAGAAARRGEATTWVKNVFQ